jgi:hypothetical protein
MGHLAEVMPRMFDLLVAVIPRFIEPVEHQGSTSQSVAPDVHQGGCK